MCLAIYKPKNATLSKQHLKNGFKANDDGAGFVISDGSKLMTYKGFFDFDSFYHSFKPYNRAGVSALVHFRFATHGAISAENCHPFSISEDLSAIHNGVLAWRSTDKESDTACFIADTMRPLGECGIELFKHPAYRLLVEKAIGEHNKIALLSACGEVVLFNEHKGGAHWAYGVWWSNRGYEGYYYPYEDEARPSTWAEKRAGAWDIESDSFPDYVPADEALCSHCFAEFHEDGELEHVDADIALDGFCAYCNCKLPILDDHPVI